MYPAGNTAMVATGATTTALGAGATTTAWGAGATTTAPWLRGGDAVDRALGTRDRGVQCQRQRCDAERSHRAALKSCSRACSWAPFAHSFGRLGRRDAHVACTVHGDAIGALRGSKGK